MGNKTKVDLEIKRNKILVNREKDIRDYGITEYANKPYWNSDKAEKIIVELICSQKPFLIGRVGETELRTISMFDEKKFYSYERRLASHNICENAGFFPRKSSSIKKFCYKYLNSINCIDYLGMFLWANEEYYFLNSTELKASFSSRILDPFHCVKPWTDGLKGKKVLVISPFEKSIQSQYAKRDKLFNDYNYLPDFELITIKAIQSIGGNGAVGFGDWFEALEYMEQEIAETEFDIALLGCGAYGLPLGAFIKSIGKQAICMGGCLQLLFGIMGSRWKNEERVQKNINENWVRPLPEERLDNVEIVENACYW